MNWIEFTWTYVSLIVWNIFGIVFAALSMVSLYEKFVEKTLFLSKRWKIRILYGSLVLCQIIAYKDLQDAYSTLTQDNQALRAEVQQREADSGPLPRYSLGGEKSAFIGGAGAEWLPISYHSEVEINWSEVGELLVKARVEVFAFGGGAIPRIYNLTDHKAAVTGQPSRSSTNTDMSEPWEVQELIIPPSSGHKLYRLELKASGNPTTMSAVGQILFERRR